MESVSAGRCAESRHSKPRDLMRHPSSGNQTMILIRQVREPHPPNNKRSETSQRQHLILHEAHWPVINVEVPVAISGPSRRLSGVVECRSGISIATLIFILLCLHPQRIRRSALALTRVQSSSVLRDGRTLRVPTEKGNSLMPRAPCQDDVSRYTTLTLTQGQKVRVQV